ncbi:hypothetical protein H5410_009129 [Solanum commersonii]|uniref:Uncharacterized protein n=1 Tax=Solanum commersonii TaxID=4109 RepID=A0A9J6AIR0_SOLCO|nr:hypothetical protein H5410_009129 [Solanum commersonii]
MLVFTQQSNEATGVGKEPLSCDEYSDGIWHTHGRSSGTGTGKWTMINLWQLMMAHLHFYVRVWYNYVGAVDETCKGELQRKKQQACLNHHKGLTLQNVPCACDFDMRFTFSAAAWEEYYSKA